MTDNRMQIKLTQMLHWFHDYCVEHNLRYYVIGGTLLGAIRHQGFIPWDDDIDVGMPRADYERLIELLKDYKGEYRLESPKQYSGKIICTYAKLYHTGTTLIEKSIYNLKKGIYVDIFPVDGFGQTEEDGRKYYRKVAFWDSLLTARICAVRKGRSFVKNAAAVAGKLLPMRIDKLVQKVDALCAARDFDSCEYVGVMMSAYRMREMMPKSYYGTPKLCNFEGIQVYGVENAEGYLTQLYGDWRKLPPEEKRVSLHDHVYMNLNESYLDESQENVSSD